MTKELYANLKMTNLRLLSSLTRYIRDCLNSYWQLVENFDLVSNICHKVFQKQRWKSIGTRHDCFTPRAVELIYGTLYEWEWGTDVNSFFSNTSEDIALMPWFKVAVSAADSTGTKADQSLRLGSVLGDTRKLLHRKLKKFWKNHDKL